MAQEELTLGEVIKRSATRAVPAKKFLALVRSWLSRRDITGQDAEDQLAAALLGQLVATTSPPAILFGYLTQSLSTFLISARSLIINLLFLLSDGSNFSSTLLISISSLVLTNPTSLDPSNPLPSSLSRPTSLIPSIPDIGTSASAQSGSADSVSTLGLILPLLRQCAIPSAPMPLVALINRLLSLLQPYPAPPLDIGLEAGSLFQSLPEALSVPLRDCLSGLMADLAISQENAQISVPIPAATATIPVTVTDALAVPDKTANGDVNGAPVATTMVIPPLPPLNTEIPIASAITFTSTLLLRSDRWTSSDPTFSTPPDNNTHLIKIAPHISPDPSIFLHHNIRSAVCGCSVEHAGATKEGVRRWLSVTERLPLFLKWWKENSTSRWPYPDTLRTALSAVFASEKPSISAYNTWISTSYSGFVSQAESDDDSGGYSQPEGWMLCSLEVSLLQRLLEHGLLLKADASAVLPGMSIPSVTPGESLMSRVIAAPKSHLKALGHITTYAPGAARSLARDVFNALKQCPANPPPEGLFANLAHSPALLGCLGGYINPATWLTEIKARLLDTLDDPANRTEDPQGSLSRFGEGVLFAEAFVARFEMPLPELLDDARRAISLADLEASKRSCVNGWIKALFGSEGIDDDIILATSPADFYRLVPGVIQQAVLAAAFGQLDIETLHGGLSYFSQPLLSWSLVGITVWLAAEIERNGPISALHLNVLQNLVLSSSFPESILHVSGQAIARLLEPARGLEAVFQSSGFDANGMRSKLAAAGIIAEPVKTTLPDTILRAELSGLRTIDLIPQIWSSTLCAALGTSIRVQGIPATLKTIVSEVFAPLPTSGGTGAGDTLVLFAVLLLVNRLSYPDQTLFRGFIDSSLPSLFDSPLSPLSNAATSLTASVTLCQILKYALLISADTDPSETDKYVARVVDELAYQRSRPVKEDDKREAKRQRKSASDTRRIDGEVKRSLEAIAACLAGDEDLRGKWERFGELE